MSQVDLAQGGGGVSAAYEVFFWVVLCSVLVLFSLARNTNSASRMWFPNANGLKPSSFQKFQLSYLIVYIFMVAGDWLQGPYVYALYESYGFSREQIAFLFVAGFGSSMIAGTFVGSLADRLGRKKLGGLYVLLYIASCLTKHNSNIYWLLFGRILGGMATSLLFSVFETWYVCEHNRKKFPAEKLSETLSLGVLANSITAIVCGVVAQYAVNANSQTSAVRNSTWHSGGFTVPFDLAIGALLIGGCLLWWLWGENYGDSGTTTNHAQFAQALAVVQKDKLILAVGLVQSLFEGAMYSFVFMWTPALASEPSPPYGTIFSTFMMSCMLGSQVFEVLLASGKRTPQRVMVLVFALSAVALAIGPITSLFGVSATFPRYCGFLLFEVCVGVYFPAIGTLKSQIVPEAYRSAIYNIFRIPLNVIVLIVLLGHFSVDVTFALCTLLLFGATCLQLFVCASLDRAPLQQASSLFPVEDPDLMPLVSA
mmetsp:Transcript_269/g.455  ORF Transcript_269/g.455 Transcript_269/m.455 type:complete len:482 (-) Transcript_269:135-1580(-)